MYGGRAIHCDRRLPGYYSWRQVGDEPGEDREKPFDSHRPFEKEKYRNNVFSQEFGGATGGV
jgi:hypothetical protein